MNKNNGMRKKEEKCKKKEKRIMLNINNKIYM
jgi:hypothetical protein